MLQWIRPVYSVFQMIKTAHLENVQNFADAQLFFCVFNLEEGAKTPCRKQLFGLKQEIKRQDGILK
jgi:hypothetical protein